jgi:LPXTG-motif cell wall-anchored protein
MFMKYLRNSFAALAVAALCIFFAPTSSADEWNKKTVLTINETVQLPNAVLQPGTYVFKLLDSPSDRHIVQVFDKDEQHLLTTILAIPNYRLEPKGKSEFTFWEVPAGQPPAMRAWFYPGNLFGQEFAYPKNASTQIAAYTKTSVPTTAAQSTDEMKSAPVTATNESGQSSDLDKQTYTPTEPAPAAQAPAPETAPQVAEAAPPPPPPAPTPQAAEPAPEPQPAPLPAELPQTATQMPAIALLGVSLLAAWFALGRFQRSRSL